jgi:hypothetical protein
MTTVALSLRRTLFLRHAGEMVLAMIAGMLGFAPLWELALSPGTLARPDVAAVIMATNMTAGMAVWMLHRGHGRAAVAEMGAAMYAPLVLLLPPWWAGVLPGTAVPLGAHLLMLPAMLLAMLHRRSEYGAPHRTRPVPHGVAARWPALLALLVTVDNWVHPVVPSPWLLLVLPGGYLVIGAARGTLRPARVAARQLGQLAGYAALTAAALAADGDLAGWLIGAGWLAHAGWDAWHHRRAEVVPRGYAEWCGVVDVVLGVTILAATLR